MSFFHRPGDSSSEEDTSSDEEGELETSFNDQTQSSAKDSVGTTEEIVGQSLTPTETLSLVDSIGENGTATTADEHRNLMLATMLEELSKYKAAEILNSTNAENGKTFDKNSPEVTELASSLFASSSSMLSGSGLLPASAAGDENKTLRQQYMAGLERWSYQNAVDAVRRESGDRGRANAANTQRALVRRPSQQPTHFLGTSAGQVQQFQWEASQIDIVRRPSTELQFPTPFPIQIRSRYSSQFEDRGMLGRGGFGRVYHSYNVLDRKAYAVKKIPLSPKLSERYQQGGHMELAHVLKEVQAMASLEHCNVVRYYGTWIEEPIAPPPIPVRPNLVRGTHSSRNQLLLDNKPAKPIRSTKQVPKSSAVSRIEVSMDPFERFDSKSEKQLWSHQNPQTPSVSGTGDPNPFSDGLNHHNLSGMSTEIENSSVYILHVQMSMYPMTLSDYILPLDSPRRSLSSIRHCFHLVPTLRIVLAILSGLQYIHAAGFIHRDIKPSNIFLSQLDFTSPLALSEGYADMGTCPTCIYNTPRYLNPRIGDFGLVADLEKAATGFDGRSRSSSDGRHKPVGTEYYRPPQQDNVKETPVDEKIDVFALGVIILELLCACGTRMERIDLLRGTQKGLLPAGLIESIKKESHTEEIVEMTQRLVSGMIDPMPKTRWRCGMVKSGVEGILAKIGGQLESVRELPD